MHQLSRLGIAISPSIVCRLFAGLLIATLAAGPAAAQETDGLPPAFVASMTPGPEHQALMALAGTWAVTATVWMDPSREPEVSQGTAVRTPILGGRVLEEVFTATFMGQPFEGRGLTGYDNVTGRFWGVWTDSWSTGLSSLAGTWTDDGERLILTGETPDPFFGAMVPMQIEVRMDGPDREIDVFYMVGPDYDPLAEREAELVKTMEMVYERQ